MLPEAAQARKAIWEAINPHTGKRRIDEAFPHELRANTKDQEMMIRFVNGSTWQVLGSDNYNSLVGSPPAGVVFSEWALANPSARAYLRPIFAENNGWQMYITTPRGKNHAHKTYEAGKKDKNTFAQKLSAYDTGSISIERLAAEKQAYIDDYGFDMGTALFEQEYLCSFEAAILGAYYGRELKDAESDGRITSVPYDPDLKVHAVLDIGWSDDTAILFFQVSNREVRLIDSYATHGQTVAHYNDVMRGKPYKYGEWLWLPHDARAKSIQTGRSTEEQFNALKWKTRIVPQLSLQDGIQATRKTFPDLWIDEENNADALSAWAQYQREWDDQKKCFKDVPLHDWTSHYSDALRYLSLVWREEMAPKPMPVPNWPQQQTINEIIKARRRARED